MDVDSDTKHKIQQILHMMRSLKGAKLLHHERIVGPRLRVVHATSEGPVKLTLKFWRDTESNAYVLVFGVDFDSRATETQVIDAMKVATKHLSNSPQFTPEETPAILNALGDELGPTG
jgi:hypothetical protein